MKYLKMLSLLLLLGCSPLDLLKSGPMLNTNAMVGAENTQVIGYSEQYKEQKIEAPTQRVEQSQGQVNTLKVEEAKDITVNETPIWMVILLVLGWLFPSPQEIARSIRESKLWKKILG